MFLTRLLVCLAIAASCAYATVHSELAELSSRVQSMAHGYYTRTEWERLLGDLDVLALKAEREREWDVLLQARLLKSVVFADLLKDPERGLREVRAAREKLKRVPTTLMPRLYVREAEILAQLGDEAAIGRLIEEFRRSPYFDPENYPFTGGWGREIPLKVVRPRADVGESLTITAMEVARQRARVNRGRYFPSGEFRDRYGRVYRLDDLRGQVVIVDFWSPYWTPWRQDLNNLTYLYKRYGRAGLVILGVPQGISMDEAEVFAKQNNMTWPQVQADPQFLRRLGVYGDAVNFIIGRDGVIIARNLRGSELIRAVKEALGSQ